MRDPETGRSQVRHTRNRCYQYRTGRNTPVRRVRHGAPPTRGAALTSGNTPNQDLWRTQPRQTIFRNALTCGNTSAPPAPPKGEGPMLAHPSPGRRPSERRPVGLGVMRGGWR